MEKKMIGVEKIVGIASPSLQLTPDAFARIREIQNREEAQGQYLRVFVSGGGCAGLQYGMAMDEAPSEEDYRLTLEGIDILIDPTSYPFLEGAVIDYAEDLMSGGFKITNPNARVACKCGTSFRPKEDPNQLSSGKRKRECVS